MQCEVIYPGLIAFKVPRSFLAILHKLAFLVWDEFYGVSAERVDGPWTLETAGPILPLSFPSFHFFSFSEYRTLRAQRIKSSLAQRTSLSGSAFD